MSLDDPKLVRQEKIERILQILAKAKDPLFERLNTEHIAKIIDQAGVEGEREEARQRLATWLTYSLLAAGLVVICFLCWLFLWYGKPEYVEKILTLIIGLVGGAGLSQLKPS